MPPTTQPRRFVRLFKPQFADLVRDGKKTQTVRLMPKRLPRVGDQLSLRTWSGLPYRSPQTILGEATIKLVASCVIFEDAIRTGPFREDPEAFARADGFASFAQLKDWFNDNHSPLPFSGIVIGWKLNSPPP